MSVELTEEMKKMPSFMVYEMAGGKSAESVAKETAGKGAKPQEKQASFMERLVEEIEK